MDETALYELIGRKIREKRIAKESGLSQDKLAELLNMSRASIVNIEAGRQRPPVHILWKIAEFLNTKISEVMPTETEYAQYLVSKDPREKIQQELLNHPRSKEIITSLYNQIKSKEN